MKKSLLIILWIGVLLVGITGCGNNEKSKDNPTETNIKGENSSILRAGDIVRYEAKEGESYTSPKDKNGSGDSEFSVGGSELWRVLYVNEDGSVALFNQNMGKNILFHGGIGWLNYEDELDNIASIYGTGEHATVARSLSYEDIIKAIGIEEVANKAGVDISSYKTDEEKMEAIITSNPNYGTTVNIVKDLFMYEVSGNEKGYEKTENSEITSTELYKIESLSAYNGQDAFSKILATSSSFYLDYFITSKDIKIYGIGEDDYRRYYEIYKFTTDVRIADGEAVITSDRIFTGAEYGDETVSGYVMPIVVLDKDTKYILVDEEKRIFELN